jgi:hypothetical protein
VSVVGARYLADGELLNETLANLATLIGALCFYFAAVLLLPLWDREVDRWRELAAKADTPPR